MTETSDLAILAGMPIFAELPEAELEMLVEQATREHFDARADVFTQGAEADSFLVLLAGGVDVLTHSTQGVERLLAHLGSGAVLGETSFLTGGTHSATARTTEPTDVLRFGYARFNRLREANAIAVYRVIYNMAHILASRLRAADVDLAELCNDSQSTVAEDDLDRLRRIFFTEWGTASRQ
jgi:CRP-like cAMP-binding protein